MTDEQGPSKRNSPLFTNGAEWSLDNSFENKDAEVEYPVPNVENRLPLPETTQKDNLPYIQEFFQPSRIQDLDCHFNHDFKQDPHLSIITNYLAQILNGLIADLDHPQKQWNSVLFKHGYKDFLNAAIATFFLPAYEYKNDQRGSRKSYSKSSQAEDKREVNKEYSRLCAVSQMLLYFFQNLFYKLTDNCTLLIEEELLEKIKEVHTKAVNGRKDLIDETEYEQICLTYNSKKTDEDAEKIKHNKATYISKRNKALFPDTVNQVVHNYYQLILPVMNHANSTLKKKGKRFDDFLAEIGLFNEVCNKVFVSLTIDNKSKETLEKRAFLADAIKDIKDLKAKYNKDKGKTKGGVTRKRKQQEDVTDVRKSIHRDDVTEHLIVTKNNTLKLNSDDHWSAVGVAKPISFEEACTLKFLLQHCTCEPKGYFYCPLSESTILENLVHKPAGVFETLKATLSQLERFFLLTSVNTRRTFHVLQLNDNFQATSIEEVLASSKILKETEFIVIGGNENYLPASTPKLPNISGSDWNLVSYLERKENSEETFWLNQQDNSWLRKIASSWNKVDLLFNRGCTCFGIYKRRKI